MGGGVSYISKRYSKTNDKYLNSYYPTQESKCFTYLNTNNLYGYAMSKFPPTVRSKWSDPKDFHSNKYRSNSSEGGVSEVHLEYPKELHELHNDCPLAPDKVEIKREMLSNYHC